MMKAIGGVVFIISGFIMGFGYFGVGMTGMVIGGYLMGEDML